MLEDHLVKIARKARKACEKFAASEYSAIYDFHEQQDLMCMCGVASFFLKDVFKIHGERLNVRILECGEHCFNSINGIAIDLTSTQFGQKSKVLVKPLDKYHNLFGKKSSVIYGLETWPKSQKYDNYNKQILTEIYFSL